ncbi:MAG: PP2C family protein-serine/threonine phosphatase [Chlamydiota bacterium]
METPALLLGTQSNQAVNVPYLKMNMDWTRNYASSGKYSTNCGIAMIQKIIRVVPLILIALSEILKNGGILILNGLIAVRNGVVDTVAYFTKKKVVVLNPVPPAANAPSAIQLAPAPLPVVPPLIEAPVVLAANIGNQILNLNHYKVHPREYRLIPDPLLVQQKLGKEQLAAAQQMANEAQNPRFQAPLQRPAQYDVDSNYYLDGLVGVASSIGTGWRNTMEDEHLIVEGVIVINPTSASWKEYPYKLYGVFDGHGGSQTAQFLKANLRKYIEDALKEMNPIELTDVGIWNAMKAACVRLDAVAKVNPQLGGSGSTATIVLDINGSLWVPNVGDSRTMLLNGRVPVQLSQDQKPDDPKFLKSIEKRGGFVLGRRVDGRLAVARSFNDRGYIGANNAYFSVSARPKIVKIDKKDIQPNSYLIMTCDGVIDVSSTTDVCRVATEELEKNPNTTPQQIAESLVWASLVNDTRDNVSALVVEI